MQARQRTNRKDKTKTKHDRIKEEATQKKNGEGTGNNTNDRVQQHDLCSPLFFLRPFSSLLFTTYDSNKSPN